MTGNLKLISKDLPEIAYERGRQEIMLATQMDEVAEIKDKAEQLLKYAKQRNDAELVAWTSAVALRAHYRIGELSKNIGVSTGGHPSTIGIGKAATLKKAGISHAAASRAETLTEIISDDEVESLCDRAVKERKRAPSANAIYLQWQDDQKRAKFEAIRSDLPPNIHYGDFRETCPQIIEDETVEFVFIDPPYDNESIPLYEDAAREAKRILKPGGSLISYCGHLQLPHVLPSMSRQLDYYWIGADVHDGGPLSRIVNYGIVAGFKPLLWFVKGQRFDKQIFVTDTVLSPREKSTHEWQQATSTAEHFISRLTTDDGLVVDFFGGGGTTAVAAKNLGRRWVLFEKDEKAIPGIVDRLK